MIRAIAFFVCLGVSTIADAASYRWTFYGGSFATRSNACHDVADKYIEIQQRTTDVASNNSNAYFFYTGECSGVVSSVGQTMTIGRGYYVGNTFYANAETVTLAAIDGDSLGAPVDSWPVQRVLAWGVAFLAFCLGILAGKGH